MDNLATYKTDNENDHSKKSPQVFIFDEQVIQNDEDLVATDNEQLLTDSEKEWNDQYGQLKHEELKRE
jgi:hypothetical protein